MKKAIIITSTILLLGLTHSAHAAITFVSTSTAGGVAAASTVTSTVNTAIGTLVTTSCAHGTTFVNPTSVTDTIGNTYTNVVIASNTTQGAISGYYTLSIGANAANIISCNFASSVTNRVIGVMQFNGVSATNTLDASSSGATTVAGTSVTSNSYTTNSANEVVVTFVDANSDGSVTSVSAPFILAFNTAAAFGNGGAYNVVSTIQTAQTVTWNFPLSVAAMVVMTFRAATQPVINPLIVNYTTGAKNGIIVNYTNVNKNSLIVQ